MAGLGPPGIWRQTATRPVQFVSEIKRSLHSEAMALLLSLAALAVSGSSFWGGPRPHEPHAMGAASCSHEAPERPRESCCEAYLQDLGLGLGSEGSTGDSTGSRPAASPRASRPSRPSREPHGSEMGTLHVDGVGRASRRTTVMGGRSLHQQTGFFVYEGKLKEAEWLTVAVEKMWKYIERAIEKLLKEDITALIKDEVPMMNSFQFSKCNFGNQSPNFGPMKVRAKDNCVELQIDMHWTASGSEIEVTVGKMKLGMKDIKLNGPILLVFCPLMGELPITGGMSITFPDPPELTWNWTGLGKALAVDVIRILSDVRVG